MLRPYPIAPREGGPSLGTDLDLQPYILKKNGKLGKSGMDLSYCKQCQTDQTEMKEDSTFLTAVFRQYSTICGKKLTFWVHCPHIKQKKPQPFLIDHGLLPLHFTLFTVTSCYGTAA